MFGMRGLFMVVGAWNGLELTAVVCSPAATYRKTQEWQAPHTLEDGGQQSLGETVTSVDKDAETGSHVTCW